MYGFQVSHISKCWVSKCWASKCLTYSSVWFPSVPHIRVLGVQVSHIIMLIHSVSCLQVPIHSVPHISECMVPSAYSFSVSCPSASHIQVSHISKCLQLSRTVLNPIYRCAHQPDTLVCSHAPESCQWVAVPTNYSLWYQCARQLTHGQSLASHPHTTTWSAMMLITSFPPIWLAKYSAH